MRRRQQTSKMKKLKGSLNSGAAIICFFLLILIDNTNATSYELKEELRGIREEIGSLRDENHQQNMEIVLLKEIAGLPNNQNYQNKVKKEQPHNKSINKPSATTLNNRQKRPFRLLSPQGDELDGDGKRKGTTISPKPQFYDPPTGCSDLSLLGYTLNGFYQVKSNESTNSIGISNETKLDTVFCAFNQPGGTSNPSLVEKRIISRQGTKPNSKIIFHAKRSSDLVVNGHRPVTITFEKVPTNSGNSFDAKAGTFTVPKSGVYLIIFRGALIFSFQIKNSDKEKYQAWIYLNQNGSNVGKEIVIAKNQSYNVELDKLVKSNRGDKISVEAFFYNQLGAKFSGKSTSLTAYLLEE